VEVFEPPAAGRVSGRDRCARCGAALPPGAGWCSLCFATVGADGSSAGAPSQPPGPQPTGEGSACSAGDGAADGAVLTVGPAPSGRDAALAAEPLGQPSPPTGWPCLRCGATVAFGEARCPDCGAGFLAGAGGLEFGAAHAAVRGPLPRSQRVLLVLAGAALVMGVLTGLAYLAGGLL
jgi:ribosomal protein L40E